MEIHMENLQQNFKVKEIFSLALYSTRHEGKIFQRTIDRNLIVLLKNGKKIS
ncbi:hypothetical protein WN51_14626 [Melipona quadrifasciata]|uniref:Uncharacterized protein n=1 Tax=Melipona quadrifasciata TaxID=166423 RepID=A0A0M9A068_9HYME|nr:hypothetical protein WN51_14626 [Melipona quadrifasciata]